MTTRSFAPVILGGMRIQFVAESFLPLMNGVTNSILRVADHYAATGHDLSIIAPKQRGAQKFWKASNGRKIRIRHVSSIPLAGYTSVRIATTNVAQLKRRILDFDPDVIHLASPAVLGRTAGIAAHKLDIPTVAVYQTDVPGYTAKYGMALLEHTAWQVLRDLHNRADLTLAPSTATLKQLDDHGFQRLNLWRRGVDFSNFSPDLANPKLRAKLTGDDPDQRIVIYIGRLAPEKQVEDLKIIHDMPNVKLIVVGDGPEKSTLRKLMPNAYFPGFKSGKELGELLATADLFIHPGELETFCQTIQEAMASGLPAIAPRAGGPVDLITPGHTGWLYTPGDLNQLRDYAYDLLFDDTKRAYFGHAAQDSVRKRSWPVLAEQLMGYYHQAIEHRSYRGSDSATKGHSITSEF